MTTNPRSSGVSALVFASAATAALGFFLGRATAPHPQIPDPLLVANHASVTASPRESTAPQTVTVRDAAAASWSDADWHRLHDVPATPRRNAELALKLETCAAHDPARALKLAQAETNRVLREQLLVAVVHGWASTAPEDAAHWVLQADPAFRETAWAALFASAAAHDSDAALRTGEMLIRENTPEMLGIGSHLIDAFAAAGEFTKAAQLAAEGAPNDRSGWFGEAYSKWATLQPEAAAQMAAKLSDPADRAAALRGVIGGWSAADPAAAVQFAASLPADSGGSTVMSQALLRWTKTDLAGATEWINSHEVGATMDQAIAAVSAKDDVQPQVAASWAENVLDPTLRSEALTNVLRRWAAVDVEAARRYAANTQQLNPEDRKEVAQLLATLAGQNP